MNIGVGFLVLAMLLTPAVDGVAKTPVGRAYADDDRLHPLPLRRAHRARRGACHRPAYRRPRGDRLGQLVRTALIMGAMTALIAALGMVPMAKAVGGFLIAPIVSGLLGIVVWREPPTVTRLTGSAISFMGAAVMLRPEAGLEPGCLFALVGGVLLGAYLAATRGARVAGRRAVDAGAAVAARRRHAGALRAWPAACRR